MSEQTTEDPNLYKPIAIIITLAFVLSGTCLFALNTNWLGGILNSWMGEWRAFMVQLFFWGMTGATIATSMFLANDKELNVNESKKESPDKNILQYPDKIDVWLYGQRIISSGFLAVFGAALLFSGLGYFDVSIDQITSKNRVFLVVFAVIIGLFENKFLGSIDKLSRRIFKGSKS